MDGDLRAFTRAYDFILWAVPAINKFPRDYRFTLGDRMCALLYDTLHNLVEARYNAGRRAPVLSGVNRDLERLRIFFRLAKDLGVIDTRKYQLSAEGLDEVGRLVGGWSRASGADK